VTDTVYSSATGISKAIQVVTLAASGRPQRWGVRQGPLHRQAGFGAHKGNPSENPPPPRLEKEGNAGMGANLSAPE
jgi:hypothetical protein